MKTSHVYKPVKPKGVLTKLTAENQQKLDAWLSSELSYPEIKTKVEKELGIPLKSIKTLTDYRSRNIVPRLRQQLRFCPLGMTLEAWQLTIAEIEKKLLDPNTAIEIRLRICTFLLSLARAVASREKAEAKRRTPENSQTEVAAEDPDSLENADIEDIHCLLFGPQSTIKAALRIIDTPAKPEAPI